MSKDVEISTPTVENREREWTVIFFGDDVILRHCLVLEEGEEINDTPPEIKLTIDAWKKTSGKYGFAVDGTRLK